MATNSPLFQSSLELLGHSISHYIGEKEIDRKLVILHLANAVELILKDLVLDFGESNYKNPKETITIHGSIAILEERGYGIPIRNKVELLIDERNALQHRFGSPNETTKIFYMEIGLEFFSSVLSTSYGESLDEMLDIYTDKDDLLSFREGKPKDKEELDALLDLAKIHPMGALLSAWNFLDAAIQKFMSQTKLDQIQRIESKYWILGDRKYASYVRDYIDLTDDIRESFERIKKVKNAHVGTNSDPDYSDVKDTVATIKAIDIFLSKRNIESIMSSVERTIDRENKEREERKAAEEAEKKGLESES